MHEAQAGRPLPPMLARVLAKLDPDEAAWLVAQVLPPWQARARRLAERDAAVMAAMAHYAHLRLTKAAERLAAALARYAATGWQHDQFRPEVPADGADLRALLRCVLRLNGGRAIGWRQICNIAAGTRG